MRVTGDESLDVEGVDDVVLDDSVSDELLDMARKIMNKEI